MGGVVADDIVTYYGTSLIRGVILFGSFPHRSGLSLVATQWALDFIPRLLDTSLAAFGPTIKEFAESCVAHGDRLDLGTKYTWMGAIAGQRPDARALSLSHAQNEPLAVAGKILPYLVLHGAMDRFIDGEKLRDYISSHFSNFVFKLWEGAGHALFWDTPEQTNIEIVAFAKKLNFVGLPFLRLFLVCPSDVRCIVGWVVPMTFLRQL